MESKRIILINPWIHDFTAYDLWLKPLGLLYIAAHLEKHGYDVQLIDCLDYQKKSKSYGCHKFYSEEITKPCHFDRVPRKFKRYGMPPEVFTKELMKLSQDSPPLLIGVTCTMTYWYPGAFEAIKYVKHIFDDTPVALGGVYASLCYEHAKKKSGADYIIKGPGEEAMQILAEKFSSQSTASSSSKHNPPLSPFQKGGETGKNSPFQKEEETRRNSPFRKGELRGIIPAYHLLFNPSPSPQREMSEERNDEARGIAMLTSHGCPFHCSYCASNSLNREFSQRPPREVIDEIKYYRENLGITDIAFYDDALLVNHEKHFDLIADGIAKIGLNDKIRFHTPNGLHIRYIDKAMAQRLYRMNFKTVRLGFESIERENDSDYKMRKETLHACVENLKQAGFRNENIAAYVLMGLPGQNIEEVDRTINFVHQCGAQARISQYSPVPGSADFDKLLGQYPEIAAEPLLHNKSVYYTSRGKFSELEALKLKARALNDTLLASE